MMRRLAILAVLLAGCSTPTDYEPAIENIRAELNQLSKRVEAQQSVMATKGQTVEAFEKFDEQLWTKLEDMADAMAKDRSLELLRLWGDANRRLERLEKERDLLHILTRLSEVEVAELLAIGRRAETGGTDALRIEDVQYVESRLGPTILTEAFRETYTDR